MLPKKTKKVRRGAIYRNYPGWHNLPAEPTDTFTAHANIEKELAVVVDQRTNKVAESYSGAGAILDAINLAHHWNTTPLYKL